MIRETSVAGAFYPDSEEDIFKYFDNFNNALNTDALNRIPPTRAVIVPHAGYVYSGLTANIAYRLLAKNSKIKTYLIIGPSHKVGFEGASMCEFEAYKTPLGNINSNNDLAKKLKNHFNIQCFHQAHHEHSTEVQFPFVKYYLPDAEIIELVYSKIDLHFLSEVINFVLKNDDCGVIISTDLSHFYTQEQANKLDHLCIEGIKKLDIALDEKGCEACGRFGVKAILKSAQKFGLKPHILDYRTSAEITHDKNRVVGYLSVCFN